MLIDRAGRARVLGWGGPQPGRAASPEGLRGQPVDGRSDLFSLGALLYELLAGRPLIEETSDIEATAALIDVDRTLSRPGRFDEVQERVPGVEPLLRRCLRGDPEQRFAASDDVIRAIEPLLHGVEGGADVEGFARAVLDGPEELDHDGADEPAPSPRLREAAQDAERVLRRVTGEHQPTPRLPAIPPAGGLFLDTEPTPVLLARGRATPSPLADLRRPLDPPASESSLWWYVVGLSTAVALAVLGLALSR